MTNSTSPAYNSKLTPT